jgi:signal transduction histidine kinase
LLSGVVWAATADPLYGWYIAVIVLHTVHLGAASGLSFQYLWPTHPIINDWYPQTFSAWLLVLAQVQFMQRFIGQTGQNSRLFRWVNGFKYFIIGATLFTLLLLVLRAVPPFYFRLLVGLTLLFSLLVVPLAIGSLYERRRQREPIVRFYAGITTIQFMALTIFFVNIGFTRAGHPLLTFTNEGLVIVSFLVDLLLLSLGVLYFGFANYRRQNERLLTALHQSEQEQSQRIIDALELERNRIAEDLYDDVGAMLSTAIGYVSSTLRKPEIRGRFPMLGEARSLLDRAVENLRTVSHNLMPKNFAQLGLTKSLAETVDKVSQTSAVQFDYVVVGRERRFDATTEVQVFRIASELINEVVKNSTATQATLQLIFNHQTLNLIAEDNGPRTPVYNNLTSKVDFIQGTLDVDLTPTGVTTIIEIPYQQF